MRLLHLNGHLDWRGGVEVYLLSLIPELKARGHQTIVGYAEGRPELVTHAIKLAELEHADTGSRRAGYEAAVRLLEQSRPDVAHIHQTHNLGVIQACVERVPTILHGHDYRYVCPASTFYQRRSQSICGRVAGPGCFAVTVLRHCMTPRPRYAFPYYRRVRWIGHHQGRFAHVIAPSEGCRARFVAAGFEGGKVTTLPYFCPIPARQQPRPMPSRETILFIGRASLNKGYRYFVEALGRLPAQVRGVMVGDFSDAEQGALRALAVEAGCAQRLELRSWVGREGIAAAFAEASVFVFPSIWPETLGIVGLEAFATGVPVVASDVGGVREWLLDGETGYLVPPKSPEALAARVWELIADVQLNRRMGERGIALIRERFSIEGHISRLEAIYKRVASS